MTRRRSRARTDAATIPLILLCLALAGAVRPPAVSAQVGPAVGGTLLGAATGVWLTLSVSAMRARGGDVLFRTADVKPLAIPVIAGATLGGLALGLAAEDRVDEAFVGAALGWGAGMAAGWLIGDALWEDSTGPWTGALVASGVGLLAGAVIAARGSENGSPSDLPALGYTWSWVPGR